MDVMFMLWGVTIFASVVGVLVVMGAVFTYGALRTLYYKSMGIPDPKKIYTIRYKVSGDYVVRLRATDAEKAKKRAQERFDESEFGEIENISVSEVCVECETSEKEQVA